MPTINVNQLIQILQGVNRAMPITFVAETDARAKKTNNPYGTIFKRSRVNGFIGYDYESCVNRQLDREDKPTEFEAQARSWGSAVTPVLKENNGKLYMAVKIQKSLDCFYTDSTGKVLDKEQIAYLLPPLRKAFNQGVDKDVIHREYSVNNIREITISGHNWMIVA